MEAAVTGLYAVFELNRAHFTRMAPLLASISFDRPQIEAALEGRQPARLFVDRLPEPGAALLCHAYDYYVVGDSAAENLRRFIADAPGEAMVFATFYGCCPAGRAWEQALLEDAIGRLERIVRRQFHYPHATPPAHALSTGFTLSPITAVLAEHIDAALHEHIDKVWGSYSAFEAAGLGCCIMAGSVPASVAYPASVSAHYADVSVGTAPEWRGRGLAQVACAALIEQCLARRLRVIWDTDADNQASAHLAAKLGFVEDAPFSELAVPGRAPLRLSHGRWAARPADLPTWPGAVRWQRVK